MSIQGQTRIELTDIHTGRTRVWEHKNRVTDALQEIFTPFGLYTDSRMLEPQGGEDANSPLLFASGGVLLLDKAVGADEDALLLPAGTAVTGSGACGQTNAGENRVRGSFNAVESQLDPAEGQLTFVYDFSTQQANGTVASICLTHRGGAMLASEDTHASADHYAYEAGETFGGQLSRGFLTFLDAETDLPYLLEMDEEADELLLARPAAGSNGTLQLTLEAYPAYTRSLDLFWQRGTNKPPCKRSQTVTVQPLQSTPPSCKNCSAMRCASSVVGACSSAPVTSPQSRPSADHSSMPRSERYWTPDSLWLVWVSPSQASAQRPSCSTSRRPA